MRLLNTLAQVFLARVGDKTFSALQYFRSHGRLPDWEDPRTFNEQIQWIKVFYRDPLMKVCADKFTVREYVSSRCGEDVLIPIFGVYDSAEAVPFDMLPRAFVLKATHGSGWNILCKDKTRLDISAAAGKLRKWLGTSFYPVGREWAYDGLTPRILCERLLLDTDGQPPSDYKFFCFEGKPRYVQVDYARFVSHTRALYDTSWHRIPCELEYTLEKEDRPPPKSLAKMIEVAARLSAPFPFVRVDLYELSGKVFFGEMTFYPGKGVEHFRPPAFDVEFGKWLRGKLKHHSPRTEIPPP